MTEQRLCPQCGSEIPAGSPAGLCPKCLVLAGLESRPAIDDPGREPTLPSPQEAVSGFVPPPPAELAACFPQLEILELLGRGGMGAVYKARQPGLDRLVALKILPPEIGRTPAFAERFTREARALARLSHPNIVAVHDIGQTADGLFYFLMEFVDGVNLRQAIRSGSMSPQEALAIVPQICDALQFAHDEGIVHRDIKPENILVDKRGRVKIADFGLAKLLGQTPGDISLTGTQQVMGTLRYMAPEQMEGTKAVDHRADIYSLGVVFYELLTGEVPVGRFAPPSKKVEIDVRLDEVVLRALEEKPEQRYQHASEVKTDVDAIRIQGRAAPAPLSDLEQKVVEKYRTEGKIPAVVLYRAEAGTSLKAAKDAVEAIARKHGIPEIPVSRASRVIGGVSVIAALVLAIVGFVVLPKYLGLSEIVTTVIAAALVIPFLIVPQVKLAYRLRGTAEGRRAGRWAALWIAILAVPPLLNALPAPNQVLDWSYRVTGTKPGRNDIVFFQVVFLAVVVGILVWLTWFLARIRAQRRRLEAEKSAQDRPRAPRLPTPAAIGDLPPDLLPRLTVTVISGVLGCLTMAAGTALAAFAVLTESPASGEFWGWMGGAFGCFFGGGGALIGAINSYRQLAGAGDLMTAAGWTWFDRILAAYGLAGAAAAATAVAWVSLASPARYSVGLLGAIMCGQAALFWVLRSPHRYKSPPAPPSPKEHR